MNVRAVLGLALADPWALGSGVVVAFAALGCFVFGGQMISAGSSGLALIATPAKLGIFAALALFVGATVALQVAAMRLRLRSGGGAAGVAGIILAFLGASCCTPLIWPAVLSLFGVSGVTLLGLNVELHQWFWLFVVLAALSLILGIWTTGRAITSFCITTGERAAATSIIHGTGPQR
jgi:hypothetical protein